MSVKTVPGALDILNQKLGGNAGDIPASSTKEYALEKIYRTLGGEESLEGVNTTSEIIEKIAGVAQGGGGSSDFSTAKVTINNLLKSANNTLVPLTIFVPVNADNFIVGSVSLLTENSTHNVIIGESKAAMLVIDAEGITVETTGSATYIAEENVVTIEGDCTITIKAEGSN